jgi:hypothetical protein
MGQPEGLCAIEKKTYNLERAGVLNKKYYKYQYLKRIYGYSKNNS